MGLVYALCMGVAGMFLVGMGSTIDLISDNIGESSAMVGLAFFSRGSGQVRTCL